jgi:hypothetical protein
VYYWLTRNAKEQQVAQLDFELELPLGPGDDGIGDTGTEDDTWEKAAAGMRM